MSDRVLVLDDEPKVAELLAGALKDVGYRVIGPAASLTEARELMAANPIDVAIFDLNVGGNSSLPLGDELTARGIPWIAVTAFDPEAIGDRQVPVVTKPIQLAYLHEVLAGLLARV